MTPRIYQQGELSTGAEISLSPQASHHLAKVLRVRDNDEIELFNGDGTRYAAIIVHADSRRCSVKLTGSADCGNESPLHITLLQGLSRNDRMDTTLQKATELGVNEIVPVICKRSNFRLDTARMEKKLAHWRQVIISACEQSGRCTLPAIQAPLVFGEALDSRGIADCRIIMSPLADTPVTHIGTVDERVSLLVGPESGFDSEELQAALDAGYQPFRLGPRVLRTETAGPAAIAAIQTLWGDFSE